MFKIHLKELFINPLNTIFICFGLFISIYCLSIGTSFFNVNFNFYDDNNNFWRENFSVRLDFKQEVTLNEIMNKVEKLENKSGVISPDYHIEFGQRVYSLSGVYNYTKLDRIYPLNRGRYFTREETKSDEKIALVGSKIEDLTYVKNNIRYIDIQGETFKVIGEIGRDTLSYWGIQVLVPMKAMPKEIYNSKTRLLELCYSNNMSNKEKYIDTLKKQLSENGIDNVNISEKQPTSALNKVYDKDKSTYVSLGFSIALALINMLIFSTFWANDLKKNITIKRVLGADNAYIIKMLFFQTFVVITISSFLAFGLNALTLNFLEKIFLTNVQINALNILVVSLFALIVTILNSIWIYRNILKFKITEYIR